ncbi:shikimate dehydrogenase [Chelatococcus sp. SYSU_G07232]|uniref:Shikimate dehydrogenase (NADP(+)) n=1 Tax=Chelatococcus albus TaxID=3047466 RepID=A0ABT7AFC4_9HYPH|nr:shikimate dehydrogenase [Chelatococcus sp. SYSU_G07232]MDJ1158069.1 shikimate dehydrogenase [Chelatococcus sp. SYSU_G07232]
MAALQPAAARETGLRTAIVDPTPPERRLLTGLLGYPIAHSASPAMHEAAAQHAGLSCRYHLIEVPGADGDALRAMLEGVRRLGFAGINVTFPYKEAVVPLLDELSPAAAMIGAVNTVVVRDGRLVGHNTDASGFARVSAPLVREAGFGPVALIGAGGVGKAAAFALAEQGVRELRIFDRATGKAEHLASALEGRCRAHVAGSIEETLAGAVGLVNGTPAGMKPNFASPVDARLLHAGLFVADAVYTPLWTTLLRDARAAGARVMTGRDLAIAQAVDAFRLFVGVDPEPEAMASAFDAVMAMREAQEDDR